MNWSTARRSDSGVLRRPSPKTRLPDSRSRVASRVKSESEETSAKASTLPCHSRSMASMMSAESEEFLPTV